VEGKYIPQEVIGAEILMPDTFLLPTSAKTSNRSHTFFNY